MVHTQPGGWLQVWLPRDVSWDLSSLTCPPITRGRRRRRRNNLIKFANHAERERVA